MANVPKINGLEALRGVACSMVVVTHIPVFLTLPDLFHEFLAVPLLGIGVDLFFVISGFVTAQSFAGDQSAPFAMSAMAFYRRRVLRLLPLLLITVLIAGFIAVAIGGTSWLEALFAAAFLGNVGQVLGFHTSKSMLSPLWSVATEMQFYLLVPFLSVLPRKTFLALTITLLVSGLLWIRPWGSTAWFWRLEAFVLGQLLYVERERISHFLTEGLSPFFLCLPLVALAIVGRLFQNNTSGLYIVVVAVISTYAAALSLKAKPSPLLEWLGRRSYAVYLIHAPILYVADHVLPWQSALVTALIFIPLVSHLLTVMIDEPIQNRLKLLNRPKVAGITGEEAAGEKEI